MNTNIFHNFLNKRKIGHTSFNVGKTNLFTAKFGELLPVYKKEVLADDYFKIGHDSLTKVQTLKAPSFAKIKQNLYSFEVANQTVWKHWNNYITNGTAYLDTYGSNTTNQNSSNQWRVPSVSFSDAQLIGKLANGWAIPVFYFDFVSLSRIFYDISRLGGEVSIEDGFFKFGISDLFFNFDEYSYAPIHSLDSYVSTILLARFATIYPSLLDLPYVDFRFVVSGSEVRVYGIGFGGSPFQVRDFLKSVGYSSFLEPSVSEPSVSETVSYRLGSSSVVFRCFCNPCTEDCDPSHGPFKLKKVQRTVSDSVFLSDYIFERNFYEEVLSESPKIKLSYSGSNVLYAKNYQKKLSDFWTVNYTEYYRNANDDTPFMWLPGSLVPFGYSSTHADGNPFENLVSFGALFPSLDSIMCGNELSPLSYFDFPTDSFVNGVEFDSSSQPYNPFVLSDAQPFSVSQKRLGAYLPSDVSIIFFDSISLPPAFDNVFIGVPLSNPEAINNGFTSFGWFIYLAKSSYRLLEYMNIPLDGAIVRSWEYYAFEEFNALPFFGYSKIWNDYFRNKTVSSAELDYSETNSHMLLNKSRFSYLKFLTSKGFTAPKWFDDFQDSQVFTSWVIPFGCSPKSGIGATKELTQNVVSYFTNELHYFNVMNYMNVFYLLTGFQLSENIFFNLINNAVFQKDDKNVLFGLICNNFYLPSYYNGLLHLKYQNFNKDYFSSATLDPMSGANQVEIPDTVTELRAAEDKQSFFERIAQNRSVGQFFETMFGVHPFHDDIDKPQLLGSAHVPINIGEVLQTSESQNTPQGNRAGVATGHGSDGLLSHHFTEHGFVFVLSSFTIEIQYYQGFDKELQVKDSYQDYPFIDFVNIGNESILQKELYFNTDKSYALSSNLSYYTDPNLDVEVPFLVDSVEGSRVNFTGQNSPKLYHRFQQGTGTVQINTNIAKGAGVLLNDVFGFIPRYSTYKFSFDECHGDFRRELAFWQTFRKFFNMPILCHEFVNWELMANDNELNKIFAAQSDDIADKFYCCMYINASVKRALPYICTPSSK